MASPLAPRSLTEHCDFFRQQRIIKIYNTIDNCIIEIRKPFTYFKHVWEGNREGVIVMHGCTLCLDHNLDNHLNG